MMTLAEPIATAQKILLDQDGVRYSSADLLGYANDAMRQLVMLVPHLFYTEGEVECVAGKTIQAVGYGDAHALVEVRRVHGGPAILPADRAALDAFDPSWHTATPAQAIHWMPVEGDPVRFLLYPPAPDGQVVDVLFVRIPPIYGVDDYTSLPETYSDPIADYIVYRAESRDDEHVNSNRAAQFMASFVAKVKGA